MHLTRSLAAAWLAVPLLCSQVQAAEYEPIGRARSDALVEQADLKVFLARFHGCLASRSYGSCMKAYIAPRVFSPKTQHFLQMASLPEPEAPPPAADGTVSRGELAGAMNGSFHKELGAPQSSLASLQLRSQLQECFSRRPRIAAAVGDGYRLGSRGGYCDIRKEGGEWKLVGFHGPE